MSSDLSGEITAIATAVLAFATIALVAFAIVTAYYVRKAFREQSREVKDQAAMLEVQSERLADQRKVNVEQIRVLGLQAEELGESLKERKRETEQRRRAQASRVFIREERGEDEVNFPAGSPPAPWVTAYVVNTSQQPVYNVSISWQLGGRAEGRRYLSPLMPGAEVKDTRPVPPDRDPAIFGAIAFFRDAAGVTWSSRPDGQFEEFPPPPHKR